ncbi:hypothetical protein LFL96_23020 [Paraburkholderia sp. D15]|uniref:hypothetical protein n=1 Tax=Paraburkholderia sp. D15 TaxID=2880218 RepID=UPI0024796FDA|nr:hypothetical protein [Paraburkholderia sp. D15]WGS53913.1 hypothetical protein LFL96_23020 [Paraburkholderia sp. D15]
MPDRNIGVGAHRGRHRASQSQAGGRNAIHEPRRAVQVINARGAPSAFNGT